VGLPIRFGSRESFVKKTLARIPSSCNYRLLAFGLGEGELSVEPKRGFGLMFLSAVELTHCTGSRDLL
jgi:hypothetical protein